MTSTSDLLGPLQVQIMRHIWKIGPLTVRQIVNLRNAELAQQGLPPLAYTTYLTVLRNLAHRKFVTQQKGGGARSHVFAPLLPQRDYRQQVITRMVEHFDGDRAALLQLLMETNPAG